MHVVRHDNSQLYAAQLDQYFRRRYDVFVRERGWTDIERPDGRDIDQFDTEDAIHLLAIDKDEVVGGLRFNPSSGPTLLNDVYPHLCFGPLSRSPDIHETTRLWVVKERRSEVLQPSVEALLVAASLELSIALGVRKTRVLFETRRLGRNKRLGWTLEPLGPPHEIDGADFIAVERTSPRRSGPASAGSFPSPARSWSGTARRSPPTGFANWFRQWRETTIK